MPQLALQQESPGPHEIGPQGVMPPAPPAPANPPVVVVVVVVVGPLLPVVTPDVVVMAVPVEGPVVTALLELPPEPAVPDPPPPPMPSLPPISLPPHAAKISPARSQGRTLNITYLQRTKHTRQRPTPLSKPQAGASRVTQIDAARYRAGTPMSNRDQDRSLREQLEQRLLGMAGKLPTSSLGRLGRTAMAGLRGGRLAWRSKSAEAKPLDVDALAALVASVGQLKGIAMKAGQMLSYLDLPLSPELRSALAVLQTHSPPMRFEVVSEIIERELGEQAPALLSQMNSTPAAAASIGQVHRARIPGPRADIEVAVKVQYPGIQDALAADFRTASIGKNFAALIVPGASVDAIVGQARQAVLEECDYLREARYQERFAKIYEGHPTLTVPAVHGPYCSGRVLTTSWVEGLRFDDFLATNPLSSERDRIGQAIFEFYVGTLFRHGLYNWDPHPGNYVFCPDGRIGMLDYGSTREFERPFVDKLARLTTAVHTDTREALHAALIDLGMVREN